MTFGAAVEWFAFIILASISIAGALGMATTMSMFRSGIFLMSSFIGVAGLFILLSADLIGLLQVMMYIGGMLVMILFMVLFSHDPGGSMMADMDMSLVEKFFSLGLSSSDGGMSHGEMDMSMTTPVRRYAAILAVLVGASLVALLLLRPAWPTTDAVPSPESARMIGHLLMNKYMMAFEGAGLLILIGIFGAVLMARPGEYPDRDARDEHVTDTAPPAAARDDRPPEADAYRRTEAVPERTVLDAHVDEGDAS